MHWERMSVEEVDRRCLGVHFWTISLDMSRQLDRKVYSSGNSSKMSMCISMVLAYITKISGLPDIIGGKNIVRKRRGTGLSSRLFQV